MDCFIGGPHILSRISREDTVERTRTGFVTEGGNRGQRKVRLKMKPRKKFTMKIL